MQYHRIAYEKTRNFCIKVFQGYGFSEEESIQITNVLLDAVVERFGTGAEVFYRPDDNDHFIVSTDVEISDQFYGWLCGFRKMAQIVSPPEVIEDFQKFLDDIYGKYETE